MSKKNIFSLVVGIILLLLSIAGYFYMKKNNIIHADNTYKVELKDVTGLIVEGPVMFHGLQVGEVSDINFSDDGKSVIVELSIRNTQNVPKDATVAMLSGGLMDGNFITLEYKKACKGNNCAENGQFLKEREPGMLENMLGKDPLATEFGLEKEDMSKIMDVFKGKLTGSESDYLVARSLNDMDEITKMMEKLEKTTAAMSDKSLKKYGRIMQNVEKLDELLDNDKVKTIMEDLDVLSKKMDNLDMEKPMKHAEKTMEKVEALKVNAKKEIAAMNESMSNAKKTLAEMETLKGNMASEGGSIEYFLSEDGVAEDLEVTLGGINEFKDNYENKKYLYKYFTSRRRFLRKQARIKRCEEKCEEESKRKETEKMQQED